MKCQFCEIDSEVTNNNLHEARYHRYLDLILCDRCTDKLLSCVNGRNINEYWTDEDAEKDGFPAFPFDRLKYINVPYYMERFDLLGRILEIDREERRRRDSIVKNEE